MQDSEGMADRPKREHASFHRLADRLTLIRLGVHGVRRRLRRGEPLEPAVVAAQLARIDQEVRRRPPRSSTSIRSGRATTPMGAGGSKSGPRPWTPARGPVV